MTKIKSSAPPSQSGDDELSCGPQASRGQSRFNNFCTTVAVGNTIFFVILVSRLVALASRLSDDPYSYDDSGEQYYLFYFCICVPISLFGIGLSIGQLCEIPCSYKSVFFNFGLHTVILGLPFSIIFYNVFSA